MFDIAFLAAEPRYVDETGWHGRWGRTVLGDFEERFIAPIGWWRAADYAQQWILGAQRLLEGASPSAFAIEAGRLWWVAWREGSDVVINQRLLLADEMARAWTADADHVPYDLVGPRESPTENGNEISEWRVCLDDIRDFAARQARTDILG